MAGLREPWLLCDTPHSVSIFNIFANMLNVSCFIVQCQMAWYVIFKVIVKRVVAFQNIFFFSAFSTHWRRCTLKILLGVLGGQQIYI